MPALPNKTLRLLREGQCALGAETALMYPGAPLIYADGGLDFVWIDLEHTLTSLERVGVVIQLARLAGITPIVRVPELRSGLIRALLDNGAQGIILPFVETPEVVAELVSWCRFHPRGRRGVGSPQLANDFTAVSVAEHVTGADEEILVAVQVESLPGVERIEEIVAVEGLDVVCLGLADLSISCGVPGVVGDAQVVAAAERVIASATARGVAAGVAGFYGSPSQEPPLRTWRRRGARFFQLFGDLGVLNEAARGIAAEARSELISGDDDDDPPQHALPPVMQSADHKCKKRAAGR
jgi:2-keto-3-deoxy-L-rhamnonate aldolase RhmA